MADEIKRRNTPEGDRISQRVKGMTEFDMKMARKKTLLADEKKAKKRKEVLDNLKKAAKEKKFNSPMARQRKIDTMKDKAEKRAGTFFTMDEMMPLKTLTSEGPGELKQMAKGGRAGLRGGGICKRGMNKKAVGKNS